VKLTPLIFIGSLCLLAAAYAQETEVRVPATAVAGEPASIKTSGSGAAKFYLVGPSGSIKRDVELGQDIWLASKDVDVAGRYIAIVCATSCNSHDFYVEPSEPASLAFLAHPSRVPTGQSDSISGVVLAFDEFQNLVLTPPPVNFELAAKGSPPTEPTAQTRTGIAWFRTSSGKAAGVVQLTASMHGVSARRVVQQVASEPCSLRIKGQRTAKGITVETDPVRDCSGNPVPDGTIVTFTARNGNQMSTVDAPVKQDIARAQIVAPESVTISAASGVVMGNELRLGGQE
jgi:hypothetical protein